jgi:hypothetical protein
MLNLIKSNENQYTFSDGRFYEDDNGQWVPSVTTILEAYPKPYALLQWLKENGENADKIRDAAGKRGSVVHQLTDDYDRGMEVNLLDENGNPKYSLEEWGMFEKYVDFATRFKPDNIMIEQNIVSAKLGFAGTIDRVMELNGKRYLVDIKTSNMITNSYWLQVAAYEQLLMTITGHNTLDGVGILWLNAKTRTEGKAGDVQGKGWQLITKGIAPSGNKMQIKQQKEDSIEESNDDDWQLFQAVHKLWRKENKDAKPKLLTYQLKHQK